VLSLPRGGGIMPRAFLRTIFSCNNGAHVDGAIRPVTGTPHRVRTDLSATLFLTAPDEYDGGELVVTDTYGAHRVKLPAGDMILSTPARACIASSQSLAEFASRRSSGSRAWCAKTASGNCCSISILRFSSSQRRSLKTEPSINCSTSTTICCGIGPIHDPPHHWTDSPWVGITLCIPLVILGLTGSVLVFEDELNEGSDRSPGISLHGARHGRGAR
jgi:hypothetical protein